MYSIVLFLCVFVKQKTAYDMRISDWSSDVCSSDLDSGAIKSYHAMIDPASLGYSITVFAMVSLKSQAEADLKAFEDHVAQLPEVRECHMLNGEIDFILKVVAKDLQSFQQFLTSQ